MYIDLTNQFRHRRISDIIQTPVVDASCTMSCRPTISQYLYIIVVGTVPVTAISMAIGRGPVVIVF